jgi:hypothetical protein
MVAIAMLIHNGGCPEYRADCGTSFQRHAAYQIIEVSFDGILRRLQNLPTRPRSMLTYGSRNRGCDDQPVNEL